MGWGKKREKSIQSHALGDKWCEIKRWKEIKEERERLEPMLGRPRPPMHPLFLFQISLLSSQHLKSCVIAFTLLGRLILSHLTLANALAEFYTSLHSPIPPHLAEYCIALNSLPLSSLGRTTHLGFKVCSFPLAL
jgi:hypothetical protein